MAMYKHHTSPGVVFRRAYGTSKRHTLNFTFKNIGDTRVKTVLALPRRCRALQRFNGTFESFTLLHKTLNGRIAA